MTSDEVRSVQVSSRELNRSEATAMERYQRCEKERPKNKKRELEENERVRERIKK